MKIYFACSIRGGRDDVDIYSILVNQLKEYGTVLTEHISDKRLTSKGELDFPLDKNTIPTNEFVHDRDMSWVLESDIVVAEVSTPSLGVGYEIGRALENKKRVLCLYREQPDRVLSAMIAGNKNIQTFTYKDIEEAKQFLKEFFKKL
jgi:nucleoside 2-deoxyribosyltransferase